MKRSLLMIHSSPWFQNLRERGIQGRKQGALKLFFLEGICLPRKICTNIFFFFKPHSMGDLPQPGTEPMSPTMGAQSQLLHQERSPILTVLIIRQTEVKWRFCPTNAVQAHPGSTLRTGGASNLTLHHGGFRD